MIKIKLPFYLLIVVFLFVSCGSDDTDDMDDMTDKECRLTEAYLRVGETTRFGLLPIEYDEDGRISVAGIQDIQYSFDGDGNVVNALLEASVGVPRVETFYTYEDGRLINARQVWNDLIAEPRYIYDLSYDGKYLDKVAVSGLFGDSTLDFDFDENGNVLTFVDWIFEDVTKFTYDNTETGIFAEPLPHAQALAFSIANSSHFWFWNNAVSTVEDEGTTLTFENEFNEQGMLIEAITGDDSYDFSFDYECK